MPLAEYPADEGSSEPLEEHPTADEGSSGPLEDLCKHTLREILEKSK